MKKMISTLLLSISCIAFADNESMPVTAINNFEPQKYLGDWYEIARIPFYFEDQCIAPVKAHYELDGDDIAVTNSCMTKSGESDIAHGMAYFNESSNIGKLQVTFVPAWLRFTHIGRGDYWVLFTDYQYSLVGSPDHKYLWILSRNETPESGAVNNLLDIATKQGFDTSKLHFN